MPNDIIIKLSIIIPAFLLIGFLISIIVDKVKEAPYEEEFIYAIAQGLYEGQNIQFKSFPITAEDYDMEDFFIDKEVRAVITQQDKLLFMYVFSLSFVLEQTLEKHYRGEL